MWFSLLMPRNSRQTRMAGHLLKPLSTFRMAFTFFLTFLILSFQPQLSVLPAPLHHTHTYTPLHQLCQATFSSLNGMCSVPLHLSTLVHCVSLTQNAFYLI